MSMNNVLKITLWGHDDEVFEIPIFISNFVRCNITNPKKQMNYDN